MRATHVRHAVRAVLLCHGVQTATYLYAGRVLENAMQTPLAAQTIGTHLYYLHNVLLVLRSCTVYV